MGRHSYFFFTHVQKAGGTTVEVILRRHFGLKHLQVNPRIGWRYEPDDFRFDRRMNPLARSFASHWLRPFVRFGAAERRIVWFTMLRDPLRRFLSHYQYAVERMGARKSFDEWIRNSNQHNWQTRLLAGEPDAGAAIQILQERYRCVGLLERFDESLLLMRERLALPRMRVSYVRPHNTARSGELMERTRSRFEALRSACIEYNRLDIQLYEFAASSLFPAQVADYGATRLEHDLGTEFGRVDRSPAERARELSNVAYRRIVYLPAAGVRRGLARLRGAPDLRV